MQLKLCAWAAEPSKPNAPANDAESKLHFSSRPPAAPLLALPLLFASSLTATQAPRASLQMLRYEVFIAFLCG
ncbi:hypothetical protein VLK31_09250 [Variovorax sp. H27-G14]